MGVAWVSKLGKRVVDGGVVGEVSSFKVVGYFGG